jgi:AcrR family transcriptional regulator
MAQRMSAAERRADLVDAAARAIVAHGLDGFRVRDVAEEAGVSQPLVSTHFRSREEIVLEAFVRSDEQAMAVIDERMAAGGDARERLRTLLALLLDDAGDPVIALSWRLWQEVRTHTQPSEAVRAAVAERERAWVARIAALLEEGIEDGSVRAGIDPGRTAMFLNAFVDGLCPAIRWRTVDLETATSLLDEALDERLG